MKFKSKNKDHRMKANIDTSDDCLKWEEIEKGEVFLYKYEAKGFPFPAMKIDDFSQYDRQCFVDLRDYTIYNNDSTYFYLRKVECELNQKDRKEV